MLAKISKIPKAVIFLNLLFMLDAIWHLQALTSNQPDQALISKFLLCFILLILLAKQLGKKAPLSIITAVLFCLVGDVLLQPLDLNYADMSGMRPVNFVLGVLCFCMAYGNLAWYYFQLNPNCLSEIKAKPGILLANLVLTLAMLVWMTLHNSAQAYLLVVVWLYSPIVVGAATLAFYTRDKINFLSFIALVLGSNIIVMSDAIIGLTALVNIKMPWLGNPVWILSTYILGIFLVFNAIVSIGTMRR